FRQPSPGWPPLPETRKEGGGPERAMPGPPPGGRGPLRVWSGTGSGPAVYLPGISAGARAGPAFQPAAVPVLRAWPRT
ncbi:MAG: hypothetical protein LBT40_14030, partial [Deltaproteobacteria bacterium]|nr:hypothetical protein [Deltaproteobacteria bacterium]